MAHILDSRVPFHNRIQKGNPIIMTWTAKQDLLPNLSTSFVTSGLTMRKRDKDFKKPYLKLQLKQKGLPVWYKVNTF